MCGFGGVINSASNFGFEQISSIASKVAFRGPDHTGISIYNNHFEKSKLGNNVFFFNRLAIIDLDSRANQPFEDQRYTLLFNGEIYNYKEIKDKLLSLGNIFQTTSDTEVLFLALKTWGSKTILMLNGMFAFVFIDRLNQTFIMARDRIGIKPFYYKREKNSLLFSSEIDSIIKLSVERPELSQKSIQSYLYLQYVPTPLTIYKDIYKLIPGHYVEGQIDKKNASLVLNDYEYWDAYKTLQEENYEKEDLEVKLVESISRQLQSDVPLGVFLSSGIDSSLITAIIHKHFSKNQLFNFFTVSFSENTISDESNDAEMYLKGFQNPNFSHHKLLIDSAFILKSINFMYDYYDEPFGDYASLLNMAISFKAKEHVSVALSGDGGDELFWGYTRYPDWQAGKQSLLKRLSISYLNNSCVKLLPNSKVKRSLLYRLEKDSIKNYLNMMTVGYLGKDNLETDDWWWHRGIKDLRKKIDLPATIDLKGYLPDAMLYKVDRSSMAASLEVRVPLLDNEIIDFALRLPFSKKSNLQYKTKAILKNLLTDLAPHYDINNPKKGFNFPLEKWMRNEWKTEINEVITKDKLDTLGLDSIYYLNIVNRFFYKNENYVQDVWFLYNLVLWYNKKF